MKHEMVIKSTALVASKLQFEASSTRLSNHFFFYPNSRLLMTSYVSPMSLKAALAAIKMHQQINTSGCSPTSSFSTSSQALLSPKQPPSASPLLLSNLIQRFGALITVQARRDLSLQMVNHKSDHPKLKSHHKSKSDHKSDHPIHDGVERGEKERERGRGEGSNLLRQMLLTMEMKTAC
eukprot:CAMPEP_0175059700 /NCGR_PEP_ID=MMETSP0052_2-20121109/12579_1 /TAXON_ID=51329 ORGANISM="Polytomella parva, Strain SAG 63-3" /NCGR_SAMPLE_ID=MMETSP0052_2 /ASSEMBLY_ACC=CAM_ASM_000194 /LENGTH=178 /DNA_ID=CAMNT_0016325281 /DNA_START=36 /DNA_END=569 /DNA_ORIENTATION=+